MWDLCDLYLSRKPGLLGHNMSISPKGVSSGVHNIAFPLLADQISLILTLFQIHCPFGWTVCELFRAVGKNLGHSDSGNRFLLHERHVNYLGHGKNTRMVGTFLCERKQCSPVILWSSSFQPQAAATQTAGGNVRLAMFLSIVQEMMLNMGMTFMHKRVFTLWNLPHCNEKTLYTK